MKRKRDLWWKFKDAMVLVAFFLLIGMAIALIVSVPIVAINILQRLF